MGCKFVEQLARLRKLSAESVDNTNAFDEFKEYIHVERPVERELRNLLRKLNKTPQKRLVLLCGSAGDGKSHLLSYLKNVDSEKLLEDYELYNDATESSVVRSNEKPCVCNSFATLHRQNPVKSRTSSSQNVNRYGTKFDMDFQTPQNFGSGEFFILL